MAFVIAADIDDLNICYVLRPEENATSDLFHFSVEDNGEISLSPPFASPFFNIDFPPAEAERFRTYCRMTFQQNVKRYKVA